MRTWILVVVLSLLIVGAVWAAIPRTINYQGSLQNPNGTPIADGNYQLTFRIYTVSSGGTSLWTEVQTLPVSGGVFSAILGSLTSLNLAFDVPYWLGITFGNEAEMAPRVALTSTPYTFHAQRADSAVTAGAHNHDDSYYTETELTTPGTINAPANPVDWTKLKNVPAGFADGVDDTGGGGGSGGGWVDDGTVVRLETSSDRVGIGTANPDHKLHVKDATYAYVALETTAPSDAYAGIQFLSPVSGARTERGFLRFDDQLDFFDWQGKDNPIHIGNQNGQIYLDQTGIVTIGELGSTAVLGVMRSLPSQVAPSYGLIYAGNTSSSPTAHASICAAVPGPAAGDAFFSCVSHLDGGWSMGLDNSDGNKFKFSTDWADLAAATKMTLTTDGNLGLGTATPLSKLDLGGGLGPKLRLYEDGVTTDSKAGLGMDMSGPWETDVYFQSNAAGHLSMGTWNGTTFAEKMRVTSGGNIGIGTTNPSSMLHVNGSAYFTDNSAVKTAPTDSVTFLVRQQNTISGPGDASLLLLQTRTATIPAQTINEFRVAAGGNTSIDGTLDVAGNTGSTNLQVRETTNAACRVDLTGNRTVADAGANEVRFLAPASVAAGNRKNFALINKNGYAGGENHLEFRSLNDDGSPRVSEIFWMTHSGIVGVRELQITGGSDVAEPFPISEEGGAPEGAVVVIDAERAGHLKICREAYDRKVAGIVSGAGGVKAGLTLSQEDALEGGRNVALSGRVYVLADASYGPIEPGDLMTTSETPGHAMKAVDVARAQGSVLGKAMSSLREGRGLVLVLVNLQ